MRTVGENILILSFALLASAQIAKKCSAPVEYPTTRFDKKYIPKKSFNSGDKVYYRCAEDFSPSAGRPSVECHDGKWSKLTLKCDKRTCGNAGDLRNGYFVYEGQTYIGERAYAKCQNGYVLKGVGFMTCKKSGWSGEFPSCVEVKNLVETTCSTPSVDNSLQKGGDVAIHQVGGSLSFTCSQGFQLDGPQQITCGPDGQWQPRPPRCLPSPVKTTEPPVREEGGCGAPEAAPGSHANLVDRFATMAAFSSGDKVYYTCDDGYAAARGSRMRKCVNGKWTKLSLKCEQGKNVPSVVETTCSTPSVDNSLQKGGDVAIHQVGGSLSFTCSQGFQLDGPQQITCGPDGQWQPRPPRCLPSPIKTTEPPVREEGGCGAPEAAPGSHANLIDRFATMTAFSSGDKVYYTCDVGYAAARGSRMRKCVNGKWTKLSLKCERKLCGHAGEILNGRFVYTGVEFGDTATAVCNEGFQMIGKATRNCVAHGWDGRAAVCEAVVCPEPKESSALRRDVQEPPYTYRTTVTYQCHVGTLVGPNEIWCTKNGTWSSSPPECREIGCPSPNVANALWLGAYKKMHEPMETISIECIRGFILSGPKFISCSREGKWLPTRPKCVPYHNWRRG